MKNHIVLSVTDSQVWSFLDWRVVDSQVCSQKRRRILNKRDSKRWKIIQFCPKKISKLWILTYRCLRLIAFLPFSYKQQLLVCSWFIRLNYSNGLCNVRFYPSLERVLGISKKRFENLNIINTSLFNLKTTVIGL